MSISNQDSDLTIPDDEFSDLLWATQSGMEFWDNPEDDADWNDA